MQIENLLDIFPDKIIAYCTGNGIDRDFKCKRISVENKIFNVIKLDVLTSFLGNYAALIQLDALKPEDVPCKEFTVMDD